MTYALCVYAVTGDHGYDTSTVEPPCAKHRLVIPMHNQPQMHFQKLHVIR